MDVSVEWVGMREMIERLQRVPEHVRADADLAIADIAEGMKRSVVAQYPTGPTGNLKRGVRVRRLAPMAYRVRSGAPHAHLYERGTKPRRTKKGAYRGVMPRFGPIFMGEKMRSMARMKRDLHRVLDRAMRGAGSPSGVGMR